MIKSKKTLYLFEMILLVYKTKSSTYPQLKFLTITPVVISIAIVTFIVNIVLVFCSCMLYNIAKKIYSEIVDCYC